MKLLHDRNLSRRAHNIPSRSVRSRTIVHTRLRHPSSPDYEGCSFNVARGCSFACRLTARQPRCVPADKPASTILPGILILLAALVASYAAALKIHLRHPSARKSPLRGAGTMNFRANFEPADRLLWVICRRPDARRGRPVLRVLWSPARSPVMAGPI